MTAGALASESLSPASSCVEEASSSGGGGAAVKSEEEASSFSTHTLESLREEIVARRKMRPGPYSTRLAKPLQVRAYYGGTSACYCTIVVVVYSVVLKLKIMKNILGLVSHTHTHMYNPIRIA